MEIERKETDKEITFSIYGSLSGKKDSTISLFETISRELENAPKDIIMDIENTSLVDSIAIGLLVGILIKCKKHNIKFKFINVPPYIYKALESTHLISVFPDFY
jgi:anti-anti-sigma factor